MRLVNYMSICQEKRICSPQPIMLSGHSPVSPTNKDNTAFPKVSKFRVRPRGLSSCKASDETSLLNQHNNMGNGWTKQSETTVAYSQSSGCTYSAVGLKAAAS